MSTLDLLLPHLGEEIEDASEETFLLFSTPLPSSQSLGIISSHSPILSLTLPLSPTSTSTSTSASTSTPRDFTIRQNPSVLQSARTGGTTGAVVWKITPVFGPWIASPRNPLFATGILGPDAVVLELGAGIAGIVPVLLGERVGRYVATDQAYALKLLRENVEGNSGGGGGGGGGGSSLLGHSTAAARGKGAGAKGKGTGGGASNVLVAALDWESDDVRSFLAAQGVEGGVDLVLACDCVYNYALIEPFVQCCVDACRVRRDVEGSGAVTGSKRETVCLVAQQLRQPDVLEEWLEVFHRRFRTWRIPEDVLGKELGEGSGFVVHLGVLRED